MSDYDDDDNNDCDADQTAASCILLLHNLVKCRSRSLVIYNNKFIVRFIHNTGLHSFLRHVRTNSSLLANSCWIGVDQWCLAICYTMSS